MLAFIIEILLEFVNQIVGQSVAELGMHSVREPFKKSPNPWLGAFGYALVGAALGGLSLLFFPQHMVQSGFWRIANLLLVPLLLGVFMALLHAWRQHGFLRLDRFCFGALFAFSFALVRFVWAL